jgi:hypothetical protein
MVWCIGTEKFSPEQIAEASDMISTHARLQLPQQRRTSGQPSARTISTASKTITRPELFHRHRLVFRRAIHASVLQVT